MATEKRRKGREGKGWKGKTRKGSDGNEDWGIGSVGKETTHLHCFFDKSNTAEEPGSDDV